MTLTSLATRSGLERNLSAPSRSRRRRFRPELGDLEARRLLSTFYWINTTGGDFNNPQNWQDQNQHNGVPGPGDTAYINNTNITVTVSQSNSVDNITANTVLDITSGTFTVTDAIQDSQFSDLLLGSGTTLEVDGGTAHVYGGTFAGTFDAVSGASVSFGGSGATPQHANAGTSFADSGDYIVGPYATLLVNSAVAAPQNFELDGGAVSVASGDSFTSASGSTFTWRGGTLEGSGTTVIQQGATLDIAGSDSKYLEGGTVLDIETASATWNDLGDISIGSGGATINNYGTFTMPSNDTIGGPGMIFNNFGTIAKSIGSGGGVGDATFSSGNFNNFGTVNGGDLVFDTSGDQDSGTWYAAADSSISFDGGSQTLNGGTALTGSGAYVVGATSLRIDTDIPVENLFLMPGSYVYGNFSLTVTGNMGWTGGIIAGPGALDVAAGATLNISDPSYVALYGTLNNAGTAIWPGPGPIIGSSGAVLNNSGTFTMSSDGAISGLVFNNSGTLTSVSPSGTGTAAFDDPLNNTGTVAVESGTLLLQVGGSSSNPSYEVAAGALLDFTNGGDQIWSGAVSGSGAGTIEFDSGTIDIGPPGATLSFSGSLFQWIGGAIFGSTLTIPSGSVINVSGSAYHYLENITADNAGTINFDGLGALSFAEGVADGSPGILNNSGTLDFLGDETITNYSVEAAGTINNSGTVLVSGGTGRIAFSVVDFNNAASGTVAVDSGSLALWGGTSEGGTYTVAAGSILDLTQGQDATFTGTYTGSGSGIVQFSGGTITIGASGATFNFPAGLFQWIGGTLSTPAGTTLTLDGVVVLAASTYEDLAGGGTVDIGGTFEQMGAGSLRLDGTGTTSTTLDIPVGSNYDFKADSGIVQGGGAGGIVNNMGTITKSAGVNTSTISASFNNLGGTLDVQSGTLTLAPAGGASNGGTFIVASGAALDLTGGQTVDYAGTYSGSGSGQVELNNGTFDVVGGSAGASLNFPSGLFRWSGGTIDTNNSMLTIAAAKEIDLSGFGGETLDGGGTLAVSGTIDQTGVGNLTIGGGTTLSIAKQGTYNIQNDSGIAAGFGPGGIVVNQGTITKTAGTGVFTISTALDNTAKVNVSTRTVDVTGAVSQVNGTTLAAGTWQVVSSATVVSTLSFASPANLSQIGPGATVSLSGPNAAFTNLAGITSNAGNLAITQGLVFTTSGSFTNSGILTLGVADTFDVSGNYTQTPGGTLTISINGRPGSGQFGAVVSSGAATLGGTLVVKVPSSFTPTVGDSYVIVTYASETGTFGTIKGLSLPGGLTLIPSYNAEDFTLTVANSSSSQPAVAAPSGTQSGNSTNGGVIAAPATSPPLAPESSGSATRAAKAQTGRNHPGHRRPFHPLRGRAVSSRTKAAQPSHTDLARDASGLRPR
jgi:hypothetical protein